MKKHQEIMRMRWVICFAIILLAGCHSATEKEPENKAEAKDTSEVYTVEIAQMKFVPAEIKVHKGDKIVFVNRDMVTHDVTEEANKEWTSNPITTGQYWTLTAVRSADYYCSIHQVMKGKIIVE